MGSFLDTEISGVLINSVASEEMLKEIKDTGLLEPNQIYLTPDEDEVKDDLFYSGSISGSYTHTITKDFENGIYDIILIGTSSKGLDLFLIPNNTSKTTYGNVIASYNNVAPSSGSGTETNFNVGTAGNSYTIFHITMTVNNGIVIIESNSICNADGVVYRRNIMRFGDGYGNITKLVFSTNNTGTLSMNFRIYKRI